MKLETVKVKRDGPRGYHTINKSSFDPAVHTLYDPEAKSQPKSDAKPSDGLKVEELKAELEKRGVAIPEGVTKKADLAELLDASAPKE